jgi:hypothetical protein
VVVEEMVFLRANKTVAVVVVVVPEGQVEMEVLVAPAR